MPILSAWRMAPLLFKTSQNFPRHGMFMFYSIICYFVNSHIRSQGNITFSMDNMWHFNKCCAAIKGPVLFISFLLDMRRFHTTYMKSKVWNFYPVLFLRKSHDALCLHGAMFSLIILKYEGSTKFVKLKYYAGKCYTITLCDKKTDPTCPLNRW